MSVQTILRDDVPKVPEPPHACLEGVVYIGHLVEDPDTGEETEIIVSVPCRRCGR